MVSLDQIDASSFEERTIVFPAVFAKAVNRFKQINFNQESIHEVNQAISKKIEPSLDDREEKIWAQWKNLLKESNVTWPGLLSNRSKPRRIIMTTFVRSSFKGGSSGALRHRELSEKVAGMLPLIYEISTKANLDLSLRNDKLKQINQQFETRRKLF